MNVALIGLGMAAGMFADAIRNSDRVRLKSVHARRAESMTAFLNAHPDLEAAAADLSDIAADPDIGFAIVATPPNARRRIVGELAAAGKPILMEKPVERTLAAATALVETCEAAGVPLGIVLQHRARPVVGELSRLDLGEPLMVECSVPWWRPQSYFDAPGRGTYARDGGGVMLTQAIHTFDLMLELAGPVAEVTAMAGTTGFHRMEAEDFAVAGLRFENGALGHAMATTAAFPGRGETITLHYRAAAARVAAGVLRIDRRDGTSRTIGGSESSGAGGDPMDFASDWHRAVIENFAEVADGVGTPLATGRSALGVHRLISAMERSAAEGRRMTLAEMEPRP